MQAAVSRHHRVRRIMAPQREHKLPGGGRVTVIDTKTASEHLGAMLYRFRNGDYEPLIFSDTGEPEGVVIPFGQWQALLDIAEDAAAAERIQQTTMERLSTPASEYVPLEDLDGDDERRSRTNDGG